MEWSSVLVGVVVGVGVGFLASYPVGYLRELGREHASRRIRRRDEARGRRRVDEAAAAAAAERETATLREQQEIERLARDRVGVEFLHRVTRDDMGLRTTVIELDPRQPKQRVIVRYEPMPGRHSTPYDPPLDQRIGIEWRSLTTTDAAQRGRTARLIEESHDEADGWIEYERIDIADGDPR